jgi:hypothetical protein
MGDAGEGLIDAESRIQERMEELEQERQRSNGKHPPTAEQLQAIQQLQSLKLARIEMQRQGEATTHEARRKQIGHALEELDRRMAEVKAVLN